MPSQTLYALASGVADTYPNVGMGSVFKPPPHRGGRGGRGRSPL